MSKGIDGQTFDGMSLKRIQNIISSLKDHSYQPKPAKRTYIPKKNGKLRPLGVPSSDDKLLQLQRPPMGSDQVEVAIQHSAKSK